MGRGPGFNLALALPVPSRISIRRQHSGKNRRLLFCESARQPEIGFVHQEEFQEISGQPSFYDPASKTFKSYSIDCSFGTTVCQECPIAVKESDCIFTDFPTR